MRLRDGHLTVYVAALTRRRPDMLRDLLMSWAKMTKPENCDVKCLVVENDRNANSESVVDACRLHFESSELLYVLEPELGIPFGRNLAAREAIAGGADLLLFVDDDEVVAQDWLVRMIAGYRNSEAVLLGAPLRAKLPPQRLSYLQRVMFSNIEERYKKKESRASLRATLNTTNRVTVVTNNWLSETSVFKDHNIWFDQQMRFTGGTDAKFYAEVRSAGLTTGWVSDAVVYETIPPERLSFWYQYRRARDQSNTHMRRKSEKLNLSSLSAIAGVVLKSVPFVVMLIAIPLTNGRTTLAAARTLGWMVGRIGFVFGFKSSLYFEVTGS